MSFVWVLLPVLALLAGVAAFFVLRTGRKPVNGVVKNIFIYPIKSTYGIEVQSAEVGKYGLKYDREWMLVDATNNFVSQRTQPKLALVRPSLNLAEGTLDVSAPGKSVLRLPLSRPSESGEEDDVTLWGDDMTGVDQGTEANEWFSDFLGTSVRLVRFPEHHARIVDQRYTVSSASQACSYADGFPYLVANEESVNAVREETAKECGSDLVTVRRFRPNLFVSGFPAWNELLFERAHVGAAVTLYLSKPCTRCKLTTVVPEKGVFGGEQPLKYVREQRKSIFGMNAVHSTRSLGKTIKVGDVFSVDKFREHEIEMK